MEDDQHHYHHDHHQPDPDMGHGHHVIPSSGHDGHADHGGHSSHEGHHQMFFGNNFNATLLFPTWRLETRADVFIACLVACFLCVGYQGTKWLRQYLHTNIRDKRHSIRSREHLFQTLLYIVEFFTSYILMLVVMTYNVWIFVVTIVGLGAGYFLFAWHKRGQSRCANDCPTTNRALTSQRGNSYDKKHSSQELTPLDENGREMCVNCVCEAEVAAVRETDILT